MSKSATVVVLCSAPWGGVGLELLTTWSLSYTSRQTFDITGTTLEDTALNNVLEPPPQKIGKQAFGVSVALCHSFLDYVLKGPSGFSGSACLPSQPFLLISHEPGQLYNQRKETTNASQPILQMNVASMVCLSRPLSCQIFLPSSIMFRHGGLGGIRWS